jgi:hypothetical protein
VGTLTQSIEHLSQQVDFRLRRPRLFSPAAFDSRFVIASEQSKLFIPMTLRESHRPGAETSAVAIHLHNRGRMMNRAGGLDRFKLEPRAVPGNRRGEPHTEEAFQLLLSIEFKRSERARRSFLLLLLDLEEQSGTNSDIPPEVAATLFSRLAVCLRETDFVGWYRHGRVVGVVLTQSRNVLGPAVSHVVVQKVRDALLGSLPSDVFDRLKVRAYQRPPNFMGRD